LQEAIEQLEMRSTEMPIASTLAELQIVIERLSFTDIVNKTEQNKAVDPIKLKLLLQDEISNSMMDFVLWVSEHRLLRMLSGDTGRHFLSYCITTYRSVTEVECVTPIKITGDYKASLVKRLRVIYPQPSRIIFKQSSMIIAGFILISGRTVVDKSLRRHITQTVPDYVRAKSKLAGRTEAHG